MNSVQKSSVFTIQVSLSGFLQRYFMANYCEVLHIVCTKLIGGITLEFVSNGSIIYFDQMEKFYGLWGVFTPDTIKNAHEYIQKQPICIFGKPLSAEGIAEIDSSEYWMKFDFIDNSKNFINQYVSVIEHFFQRIGLEHCVKLNGENNQINVDFQTWNHFYFYASLFYLHLMQDKTLNGVSLQQLLK